MSIRPLTAALAEVARVELNEEPKRTEECLNSLKDWIRKQPHLIARTDDQWLIGFLRSCKWSLERTKEKIDLYYSLRSSAPDLFALKHTDPKVIDILDSGTALVLPKLASPAAPRVVLIRPGSFDPDQFSLMEVTAVTTMQQKICFMEDDNVMVSGAVNILDLKGIQLGHFIGLTPLQMKKIITLNQEAAPLRMKAVHVLNMPSFFETILNLAKSFLNEKNKQRLHVYRKDSTDIYNYVSQDILPIEYGGQDYNLQQVIDYWKMKFQEYHQWLEEDLQYGTVESKRPGKSKLDDIFGVQGSFKKLEID